MQALYDEDAVIAPSWGNYWSNPGYEGVESDEVAPAAAAGGAGGWAVLWWVLFAVALLLLLFFLWSWASSSSQPQVIIKTGPCPATSTMVVPVVTPAVPVAVTSSTATAAVPALAASTDDPSSELTLTIPTRFGPYKPKQLLSSTSATGGDYDNQRKQQQQQQFDQQMQLQIQQQQQAMMLDREDRPQTSLALGPQQPLNAPMYQQQPGCQQGNQQSAITGGLFAPGAFEAAKAANAGKRKLKPVNRNQRTFVKVGQRMKIPHSNRASHENALRLLPSESVPSDSRLAKVMEKWAGKTPNLPTREEMAQLHSVRQEQVLLQSPMATCGGPKITSDFTITRAELPKPAMPSGMDFNQPVRR